MTIEDIALQMTPGIGVKGAVHLLGVFGSARDIFAAAPDELAGEAGLREEIAREIVRRRGFAAAEKELEHCRRNGIAAIASTGVSECKYTNISKICKTSAQLCVISQKYLLLRHVKRLLRL